MSELKPGDKVRIKRLEEITDTARAPGWVGCVMDRYAGCELTVKTAYAHKKWFDVEECSWAFSPKWIDKTQVPITVPVDPSCVPVGYRAVRVGVPKKGENGLLNSIGAMIEWEGDAISTVRLIIEKIPDPIVLPDWIPTGWWITKDEDGTVGVGSMKPEADEDDEEWLFGNESILLIAEDNVGIPQAYLDLPWKESLMQKEVKG